MTEQTRPNQETRAAERAEAQADHGAPQVPTAEEEQAAERNDVSSDVAENYEEMTERGANQQGEGRI